MSKARQSAQRRPESRYVVAPTSAGLILGQVVHESATGIVTLRMPDGSTVDCKLEGRLAPAADPAVFGEVLFVPVASEDASEQLEPLLSLFREERKTAEERRAWAADHGAPDLSSAKEIDELLKYRYEQYRAGWAAALRALLGTTIRSGNERSLLAVLDQSVPTDARRIATDVAVDLGVAAAVPALCAAAIHKTQAAFGQDAVRALRSLAPERLPLITRVAHPDVAQAVDMSATALLAEAVALDGALTAATNITGSGSAPLRNEVLAHLAIALPAADQMKLFGGSENSEIALAVTRAVREPYRSLADKESPTGYELLLRSALAQIILTASSNAFSSELRTSAARDLVRDAEWELLRALVVVLPDTAVTLLVRVGLSGTRTERASALLTAVAEDRPELAHALAPTVRAALSGGQLEYSQRLAALRLLAADTESHTLVSREVSRELGRELGPHTEDLVRAVVRHEVPLEMARVRLAGRAELLRGLPLGTSRYAAAVLRALRSEADDRAAWSAIDDVVFPEEWVATDPAFRIALLGWMPAAVASALSPAACRAFAFALREEAPALWSTWPTNVRQAALFLLGQRPAAEAASLVAMMAARLAPGDDSRSLLIAFLAGRILPGAPQEASAVAAVIPETELRLALLAQGAELEQRISERAEGDEARHGDAGRRLAADLKMELERARHALGTDDQLGVLFGRLAEEVATVSQRDAETDPEIAAYLLEFSQTAGPDATTPGASALIAALRRLGGRSRSSQAALAFFRDRSSRLLDVMMREEVERFVEEHRRVLDRLDLAAVEPIAIVLLRQGSDAALVWSLLGSGPDTSSAINVALRVAENHPAAALGLLAQADVELRSLAQAVGTRAAEWEEITTRREAGAGGVVDLARRLAPILEAIEGLLLNYMRVRRVLAAHGVTPLEPVLGNTRDAKELIPGAHRVVGLGVVQGRYEVLTQGMRTADGDVIIPAVVARRADEEPTGLAAIGETQ